MSLTQQILKSVSAASTALVTVPVNSNMSSLVVSVGAYYAAVSATASGVQLSAQYSVDGAARATSSIKNLTVAPAATVIGEGNMVIPLDDSRKDPLPVEDYVLTITNLDGTNAALVSVISQSFSGNNFVG